MPLDEESMKIASIFTQYFKTGDKNLIKNISEYKLERALIQYDTDQGFPHYFAMANRLDELKDKRKTKGVRTPEG